MDGNSRHYGCWPTGRLASPPACQHLFSISRASVERELLSYKQQGCPHLSGADQAPGAPLSTLHALSCFVFTTVQGEGEGMTVNAAPQAREGRPEEKLPASSQGGRRLGWEPAMPHVAFRRRFWVQTPVKCLLCCAGVISECSATFCGGARRAATCHGTSGVQKDHAQQLGGEGLSARLEHLMGKCQTHRHTDTCVATPQTT